MAGPDPNCKLIDFQYEEGKYFVTDEMKRVFDEDGGVVVRGLLTKDEVEHLNNALTDNKELLKHAYGIPDGSGGLCHIALWGNPGEDLTGMVARSEKVVNTCEALLGGEVYHYHTKLMMKKPRTGGRHVWHQDYGYWYKNGCLKPDMLTVFIPVDPCIIENGCLQVLRGSHKYERINHDFYGGQQQADPVRVEALQKRCDWVYVQMQPGDALFFHSNLLHTSDKNESDLRRWCFLCAYNRADNDPIFKHHHPNYTPLHKVPNSAILSCTNYTDFTGKEFLEPDSDKTTTKAVKDSNYH